MREEAFEIIAKSDEFRKSSAENESMREDSKMYPRLREAAI